MNRLLKFANALIAVAVYLVTAGPVLAQAGPEEPPMLTPQELQYASGEQLYRHICQGCHMPDGAGATGAGRYPALAGNPRVASAQYMATIILYGRGNMPSFMARTDLYGFAALTHVNLGDADIAAVVNFVRSHFGNQYTDELTAADVAALHAAPEHRAEPVGPLKKAATH